MWRMRGADGDMKSLSALMKLVGQKMRQTGRKVLLNEDYKLCAGIYNG